MIIVTGSIAYDYILDFPGRYGDHILPDQLHKINLSFITKRFEKRRGGTAGNASYCLGHLNTPHILFSYAGKDITEYKKDFEKVKINTSKVLIDKSTFTATGFAITDKDDNQIWGYFYGAAENNSKLKLKTVAKKGDLVLAGPSGTKATMSIVDQCVKENLDYMFDPGFILTSVNDEDLELGVKHCKYLIGNDYEITLTKNRLKNWKSLFKDKIVITTLGEKGALIETDEQNIQIKAAKPKKVVDPTGAGDAFRAGFLTGAGKGFNLKICGQMGAVAASFAVEEYGTQGFYFTLQQFKNRYRQNYRSVLNL